MSIYFQYPSIDEYPNAVNTIETLIHNIYDVAEEDEIAIAQKIEIKDYLALKFI